MGSDKGGGQPGNRNAIRHGLVAGQLPKGAAYVKRECDLLRRGIEGAVLHRHGEVTLYHAAIVQTAVRWERHALLAQRWLRREASTMDAATRLSYSRDIARASAERDRCLKALGLDSTSTADILDALYKEVPDESERTP